jgi:hypothetical protein
VTSPSPPTRFASAAHAAAPVQSAYPNEAPARRPANISSDDTTAWLSGGAVRRNATDTAAMSFAGTESVPRSIHVISVMTAPPITPAAKDSQPIPISG